jgi:hypothetical protein
MKSAKSKEKQSFDRNVTLNTIGRAYEDHFSILDVDKRIELEIVKEYLKNGKLKTIQQIRTKQSGQVFSLVYGGPKREKTLDNNLLAVFKVYKDARLIPPQSPFVDPIIYGIGEMAKNYRFQKFLDSYQGLKGAPYFDTATRGYRTRVTVSPLEAWNSSKHWLKDDIVRSSSGDPLTIKHLGEIAEKQVDLSSYLQ